MLEISDLDQRPLWLLVAEAEGYERGEQRKSVPNSLLLFWHTSILI
jgi:hypothetical protein